MPTNSNTNRAEPTFEHILDCCKRITRGIGTVLIHPDADWPPTLFVQTGSRRFHIHTVSGLHEMHEEAKDALTCGLTSILTSVDATCVGLMFHARVTPPSSAPST